MAKRKRNIEAFSLSFLDCICCGFGAIILLLVLSKIYEPAILEKTEEDLNQIIAALQEQLFDIRGDTVEVRRELGRVQLDTSETKMRLQTLQKELSKVQGQFDLLDMDDPALNIDEGELRAARQRLTEEMLNLRPFRRAPNDAVGGIPVDSEYIIFVIDTSGSMQAKWTWAENKLAEVLNVYPRVKGLQIMNDNGSYMFPQYGGTWISDTPQIPQYGGTWISDTPQIRESIKARMRQWQAFSDSNPADGIVYAIKTFWAPDKKISIYVFGDEFQGASMESNFTGTPPQSSQKFAGLMRVLCERNGGTFVALTERVR
jgi:hypothetical protein